MNWSAELVADVWLPTATVTSTVPVPAGLVALQDEVVVQLTEVAGTVPKLTVVPPEEAENPVPVMATLVPPDAGPVVGLMVLTVGALPPEPEPT